VNDAALQAMVRACQGLARPGLADLVSSGKLAPQTIVSLMQYSLHELAAEHCAIILLAGALAEDDGEAWSGSPMQTAIRELCDDDEKTFQKCKRRAEAFA
jgi:hypothetical protein